MKRIVERIFGQDIKPRRIAMLAAVLALAAGLSGCVVYPAGPGYYGHPHYWHHDRDWR